MFPYDDVIKLTKIMLTDICCRQHIYNNHADIVQSMLSRFSVIIHLSSKGNEGLARHSHKHLAMITVCVTDYMAK